MLGSDMSTRRFRPILLGSDLGVYSMARSFHEAYGVTSTVVSNLPRGPINHSKIIDLELVGAGAGPAETLATLKRLAATHRHTDPEVALLLIVGTEHEVEFVADHREQLAADFTIPMAASDLLRAAADKTVLHDVCRELGIPVPAEVTVSLDDAHQPGWQAPIPQLRYPAVIKPARGAEHLLATFPGKKKVYPVADGREAQVVLERLAAAGLRGTAIVQEMVLGDDTNVRTVTCYIARDHTVTMLVSGRLLLGLHAPTMVGNSAAILTEPQPELEQQAVRILQHLGYTGFANFDIKIDSRDGTAYFLDLNPRVGRPNYYANVAGQNPARAVVNDMFDQPPAPVPAPREGVYSYVPWPLLRRYLSEPELRRRVAHIRRRHGFHHPLAYAADRNPRRTAYRVAAAVNLIRDFRRHYPRPTTTGF